VVKNMKTCFHSTIFMRFGMKNVIKQDDWVVLSHLFVSMFMRIAWNTLIFRKSDKLLIIIKPKWWNHTSKQEIQRSNKKIIEKGLKIKKNKISSWNWWRFLTRFQISDHCNCGYTISSSETVQVDHLDGLNSPI